LAFSFTYLPYSDTGAFSRLVTDYLGGTKELEQYYAFAPDAEGIKQAIEQRKQHPVDRKLLVETLKKQYDRLSRAEPVQYNMDLLLKENTFTVCTAHQPNLLTGYLYFIYKIVHAIKLAHELKQKYPEYEFVPVYYMGSEDNDLDELGTFRYGGKKFVWDGAGQKGAVGRMNTASLEPLLNELFKLLGPPGEDCDRLKELISAAYLQHDTIAAATQYLVNELFGRYGLIVLDPDDAALKKAFVPVMQDDLLKNTAYNVVTATTKKLEEQYKIQATPRPINLFYLQDGFRERIETAPVTARNEAAKQYSANGGDKSPLGLDSYRDRGGEAELLTELNEHPERFSPNVILRGLFQETILPDVAFIGGGAEVAYWLQLKPLFEHYKVFYPPVLLRQSVLWIEQKQSKQRAQLGFKVAELFKDEAKLVRQLLEKEVNEDWQTKDEAEVIEKIVTVLKLKAEVIDRTLGRSADAVLAKIKHQLSVLETKMLRAEKRKMEVQVRRIAELKHALFPASGLQERTDNFMNGYLQYGARYTDILHDLIQPLKNEFLVIEHEHDKKA
jgi:bacillithiol biosynthesis cysteine-adding enzyme BshC